MDELKKTTNTFRKGDFYQQKTYEMGCNRIKSGSCLLEVNCGVVDMKLTEHISYNKTN